MQRNKVLGSYGEEVASKYLQQHGWEILDRNWRCTTGEIDIVATRGNILAVCEVKTRRSSRFGSPIEAVTPEKYLRLRRLAGQWLHVHEAHRGAVRIDIIAVMVDDAGMTHVQHIEAVGV